MAITQTTYTGNGSTTNYSFTFEYLKQADVKVTLDTVATTAFTFANATTLAFTTAPANGVAIRIFRDTAIDTLSSTFFPGSAIKAEDLNQNFTQNLYVTQESDFEVDTANATANTAKTTANTAKTTADTALTNSTTAISTANAATATANTADTNASSAVTTANTASTNATTAVNTANAASAAVSAAAFYTPVAALANLPGSPSNEDRVEVLNSTGVESNSSVSGVPTGFVGSTDLTIRLQYNSSTSKWAWQQYFAADPENRYLTQSLPVVKGDSTNGSGQLTLNCENNSHGIKIKGPPHSAAATYTLTLPNDTGTSGQALKTDGSGVLSFADVSSSFITQTDFAYKPSSNTATLAGPSTSNNPTGYNKYVAINTATALLIRFEKSTNLQFYNLINQLSSGDSIDINWNNAGTQRTDTKTFNSLTDTTVNGVLYGELEVNGATGSFGIGSYPFGVTSTNIINGTEPIANNQVLRYKTATNKWTVDDAETIAICDGGNFANGSSLVQTSTTFDGGSF